MIPAGRGKVISITLSPHQGQPGMVHSSAARAAVENLMRALSIEWARYGIALNAIAAGQFGTDTLLTKYPQQIVETLETTIPLGRLGRSEEIAWLVAHLASPAGDFISGTVLTVDGARDNWYGQWPPSGAADADGNPLAEARRAAPPAT
jgi:citronellol/citronellal dehydrogenase